MDNVISCMRMDNVVSCMKMDNVTAVFHRRINLFFVYSVLLQVVQVLVFTFSNFHILQPLVWLQSGFARLASLSAWLHFVILIAFLIALCGVMEKRFLERPYFFTSRFQKIKGLFTVVNVRDGLLFSVVSMMISLVTLAFLGGNYATLHKMCTGERDTPDRCVVEEKVYLILSTLWSGIFCFVADYMHNSSHPVFPLIQQLKFIRLKVQIFPSLRLAMKRAVWPCVTFPLIYLWIGDYVVGVVCDLFALNVEKPLFETLIDLLNLKLMCYSWFLSSVFFFTVINMENILNILLTERCKFCVSPMFGVKTTLLHEVLALNQPPLFTNWGYLELLQIARSDRARRRDLFSLSLPGGHPNNWNAVVKECLVLIEKFSEDLGKALTETSIKVEETSQQLQPPPPKPLQPYDKCSSMRNLSVSQFESMTFRYEHSVREAQAYAWNQVRVNLNLCITRLKSSLMKKPGIYYIFGRMPDAELKHLYVKCFPVINAVQALAFLISASVTEDTFGVVQKDLNIIISAILELKIVVDKALKIGHFKRVQKSDFDFQMKTALNAAVSRSIYKLCYTFRGHLLHLDISPNAYSVLHSFLSPPLE